MTKREDGVSYLENLLDIASEVYEEMLRKAEKINHESSSFSLGVINNEPPILSGSEMDDEEQSEAKIGDHEIHDSSSCLRNNIDLNEPPSVSEREEPQNPDRCSLSLLGLHSISKNPPNPNHQSSPSSRKRPLERMGRSIGSLKKAKKSRLKAALEVQDMMLIFKKTLSKSDVNLGQSRFLIPFNQLERNDFLTPAEWRFIQQEEDEEGEKPGVGAILVNQRSESWGLMFKRWVMKKKDSENVTLNYVLNCGWNNIVKDNELKANDNISLCSFRSDGVLCFALTTHPPTMAHIE